MMVMIIDAMLCFVIIPKGLRVLEGSPLPNLPSIFNMLDVSWSITCARLYL